MYSKMEMHCKEVTLHGNENKLKLMNVWMNEINEWVNEGMHVMICHDMTWTRIWTWKLNWQGLNMEMRMTGEQWAWNDMTIKLDEMRWNTWVIRTHMRWKLKWCKWQCKWSDKKWHYMNRNINWNAWMNALMNSFMEWTVMTWTEN